MDVLVALYFRIMNVRPDQPDWSERDRFVLSKGHSTIALYVVMALRGYFPLEELKSFDALNSRLQGHPDMTVLPGLDMSSGSLGLGFSAAVGMALGGRDAGKDFTTYVMLGDGECNEGIVWEGAHVAGRYHLDNLVAIVDLNGLQQYGWHGDSIETRLPPYHGSELVDRWSAFGWRVLEMDGHDMSQIVASLGSGSQPRDGRPTVVISHTIKGKGVSFMEGNFPWHSQVPDEEQLRAALAELGEEGGS
jgi:transketolase